MKKAISFVLCAAMTLFLSTCTFTARESPDYLAQMTAAVLSGDLAAGKQAELRRNALIDQSGSGEVKVSFDELYLLSKYIYARAGSFRLSNEMRMCVGEVALNRAASPEFSDNLIDIILDLSAAPGAVPVGNGPPSRACVDAALRLLLGERMMEPSVVYQSGEQQGEVYASFCDKLLGFTYFCKSPNGEMYA